jgi:RNA polymerase sigma-70 factor, ECF subfamily
MTVWAYLEGSRADTDLFTASVSEKAHCSRALRDRVEQYFSELREPVFRYLLSCAATPISSEEITQEVFLRLYRHLNAGERVPNLRAWVFRVAHNLLIDQRRREQKLTLLSPGVWNSLAATQSDSALDPEEQFLRKEQFSQLQQGIAELVELERQCIYLRAAGLRYREVADVLGISMSAAVDCVNRAIRKLAAYATR